MLQVIFEAIGDLLKILAALTTGKMTENEARAECNRVGQRITETDSDAELAEYDALLDDTDPGDPEPPRP